MNQVPLTFVNIQDDVFTTDYENYVNIKCPKESLQKFQFTMHIYFNAVTGKYGYGWRDIVFKGTGNMISQEEKYTWDDYHVEIFWKLKV